MHLPDLPPEALTVIATAFAATALSILFPLASRFRRIKFTTEPNWTTYYDLDGCPFKAEVTEVNPHEAPWL